MNIIVLDLFMISSVMIKLSLIFRFVSTIIIFILMFVFWWKHGNFRYNLISEILWGSEALWFLWWQNKTLYLLIFNFARTGHEVAVFTIFLDL